MTFNPVPKPQKAARGASKPLKRSYIKSKPKAAHKRATSEEMWYMGQVKQRPCVITGEYGVDAHHACYGRLGRNKWNGFSCLPLIDRLHSRYSKEGIHHSKDNWEALHGPDFYYIIETLQAIYGDRWSVDH